MQNIGESKMEIYDLIKDDELTEDLALIRNACGMDTVRILLKNLNGLSFYIPKITRLDNFISRYLDENKSKNPKQLARELNVTEQHIKYLMNRDRKK